MRGIGRERLARYVSEFLSGAGYRVEEKNELLGGQPASRLVADLARPNPAVPSSFTHLEFLASPTAAGSSLRWEVPSKLAHESERSRAQRLATELLSNLEQRVALESRSAGRITKESAVPPPLLTSGASAAVPASSRGPGAAGPRSSSHAGSSADRSAEAEPS
ncbi:MAG: hypothetical protein KGI89_12945 [Euryarchaeota archaeon]|nr:hypothetical protein [Euryarchaeota archaeon]